MMRRPDTCYSPLQSTPRTADGGVCLVPQLSLPSQPPAAATASKSLTTTLDGGTDAGPSTIDVMRASGYMTEECLPSEQELPFGGLGVGITRGPNGVGREMPWGRLTFDGADKMTPELVRRDPKVDDPRSYRPQEDGRNQAAPRCVPFRATLPDGGTQRR
jgi:hypothetical protein